MDKQPSQFSDAEHALATGMILGALAVAEGTTGHVQDVHPYMDVAALVARIRCSSKN
jgi:hypothetical protein